MVKAGDLINIDVSAELDGNFGDTGTSFAVPPTRPRTERLCRDGRRAMWVGIRAVMPSNQLNEVGRSIESFARRNGYSVARNLASLGVGGLVFTIEPFLSLGVDRVEERDDGWSLRPPFHQPTRTRQFCRPSPPPGSYSNPHPAWAYR